MTTKTKKGPDYAGWNTREHLEAFDMWNAHSDMYFNYVYGCFSEQVYLKRAIEEFSAPSILDVGCATGTTYRYIKNVSKGRKFEYAGVDLSQPAIDKAKKLYPGINFQKKEHESLSEFCGRKFDIVSSRDTVMHQLDPLAFFRELLSVTQGFLIVRLRTRDKGKTVFDVEQSCQMNYDSHWMPYIVLNIDELLEFIKSIPGVARVTINRSYEVLGGRNSRFLPKDLYFTEAGGAETSVSIRLGEPKAGGKPEIIFDSSLQGHAFIKQHHKRRLAYSLADKVLSCLR